MKSETIKTHIQARLRSNEEPKYEISRVARAYACIWRCETSANDEPVQIEPALDEKKTQKKQQRKHYLYIHNHCDTFFIFIN